MMILRDLSAHSLGITLAWVKAIMFNKIRYNPFIGQPVGTADFKFYADAELDVPIKQYSETCNAYFLDNKKNVI